MSLSARDYCFTIHLTEGWSFDDTKFNEARYLVLQLEECPETGSLHYQGYIELKNKTTMTQAKTIIGAAHAHLEKRRGTRTEARDYCMKDESRLDGPWEYGTWVPDRQGARTDITTFIDFLKAPETTISDVYDSQAHMILRYPRWTDIYNHFHPPTFQLEAITLRPWQSDLMEKLSGPWIRRKIYWIWSQATGTGKTTFSQWIYLQMPTLLTQDFNWQNLCYALKTDLKVIWFNLPRDTVVNDQVLSTLEKCSDGGPIFSTKYQSMQKVISAHVVVTANCGPPEGHLPGRVEEIHID